MQPLSFCESGLTPSCTNRTMISTMNRMTPAIGMDSLAAGYTADTMRHVFYAFSTYFYFYFYPRTQSLSRRGRT